MGQHIEQIKHYFNNEEDVPSDLLFVNVAYDRQLVDVFDEFGFPKGNIDITDRGKLLRLLENLRNSNYKYIVLDVAFSNEYASAEDSALFKLISSMDNIVIPKSENITLADSILYDKARYSDYSTYISETNFVKYEFIRNGETTLPYQLYLDLYGDKISHIGPFYFFNGQLANKSVILRHPIKLWNKFSDKNVEMAESRYYNLGSEILDLDIDPADLAENKIVIIGDFTEHDIHDTYMGKISGPVINVNAYLSLKNNNLSIPSWYILFLIGLYMAISYCIIMNVKILKTIKLYDKIKFISIRVIISSLGLTSLLTVIAILIYLLFSLEFNILIPSIYFSVLLACSKYKYYKTSSKQTL